MSAVSPTFDDAPKARVLCVFGTASDVGKSLVATALCRLLSDQGLSVMPYKAQNMSNNSGVTAAGLEMGRAQVLQAQAARVEPHVDMNPVLLKPEAERRCQVVLLGKPRGASEAREYFRMCDSLRSSALEALDRLRRRCDVVVVEGAGSCAEVNLRQREYVNFPVAHHADAPVLLVADIERGGVFAQLVGSLEVMLPEDRARVRALLVNRFRGDPSLFEDGVRYLEARTGLPVVGVVPFAHGIHLEAEDALHSTLSVDPANRRSAASVQVGVLHLPHVSNVSDFDGLGHCPGVELHFLVRPRDLAHYDLVVLPGSKAVRDDLAWLRQCGWEPHLRRFAERGGTLLGICGGYQMLGQRIDDPEGVEGTAGTSEGLGLLPVRTRLQSDKRVKRTTAHCVPLGATVRGYEIHMGVTEGACESLLTHVLSGGSGEPALTCDGAISEHGNVWGCYLHGLLDEPAALLGLLERLAPGYAKALPAGAELGYRREVHLERWAAHFREAVDVPKLWKAMGLP